MTIESMLRRYSQKVIGFYKGEIPVERASLLLGLARIGYFFSATGLGLVILKGMWDYEEKQLLMGKPVLDQGFFPTLKRLGSDASKDYIYTKEKGWHFTDNPDKEMLEQEKKAFQRAYDAQKKHLEAGKKLPEGAIVLVDEKDIKRKA